MLRRLAAKGLVEADETEDGRRSFSLTDEGRTFVEEHREEWGQPWLDTDGGRRQQGRQLKVTGRKLAMAVTQVASVGTDDQIRRTEEILDRTRRRSTPSWPSSQPNDCARTRMACAGTVVSPRCRADGMLASTMKR